VKTCNESSRFYDDFTNLPHPSAYNHHPSKWEKASMEQILIERQAAKTMMAPAMRGLSTPDQKALQKWRRRGKIRAKAVFLFTVAIFVSALTAVAVVYTKTAPSPVESKQQGGTRAYRDSVEQESQPEVVWLSSQLGLSDAQMARIKPFVDDEERKIDLAVGDPTLTSEARIAMVNQIRLDTLASLAPILTATQGERLLQLRDQERAQLRAVWEQSSQADDRSGDE
jgi:hypothetical protein